MLGARQRMLLLLHMLEGTEERRTGRWGGVGNGGGERRGAFVNEGLGVSFVQMLVGIVGSNLNI